MSKFINDEFEDYAESMADIGPDQKIADVVSYLREQSSYQADVNNDFEDQLQRLNARISTISEQVSAHHADLKRHYAGLERVKTQHVFDYSNMKAVVLIGGVVLALMAGSALGVGVYLCLTR